MNFTFGKKYLVNLINSSARAGLIFSIDNHSLEVVAADLVPVQPFTTNSLFIGNAQRYSVIVEAIPNSLERNGNYWMRTRVVVRCGDDTIAQHQDTTGILRYNSFNADLPTSIPQQYRTVCEDELPENIVPVVPWNIGAFQNTPADDTFEAGRPLQREHGYFRWALAEHGLYLDYGVPTILQLNKSIDEFDPSYAIVDCLYPLPFANSPFTDTKS